MQNKWAREAMFPALSTITFWVLLVEEHWQPQELRGLCTFHTQRLCAEVLHCIDSGTWLAVGIFRSIEKAEKMSDEMTLTFILLSQLSWFHRVTVISTDAALNVTGVLLSKTFLFLCQLNLTILFEKFFNMTVDEMIMVESWLIYNGPQWLFCVVELCMYVGPMEQPQTGFVNMTAQPGGYGGQGPLPQQNQPQQVQHQPGPNEAELIMFD